MSKAQKGNKKNRVFADFGWWFWGIFIALASLWSGFSA
jgi:hypothetical protein